jgi:hypothetical protein
MRPSLVLLILATASACAVPFRQSTDEKKAECDRIAAQAIQTKSLSEAKTFAAEASACYARQQGS